MAGYIGPDKPLTSDLEQRETHIATAGQVTFAGTYSIGYVDAFRNGTKLDPNTEFTALTGSSIDLVTPATVGDKIEIIGRVISTPYDYYLKSQVDAKVISFGVAAGSGDAMAVSLTPPITSLVDGQEVKVRIPSANTTTTPAITFTDIGLGKTITKLGNQALKAGDMSANQEATFRFNSSTNKMELIGGTNLIVTSSAIQPITATVSSNALTITLNPTILDFRSSVLSSGTVNTRKIASPISIVISNGSTLGSINAVKSKILVLALDNNGTIELAVSNSAGGLDLSEANLINTLAEGGIGGADTAAAVYSTTARSNLPYRVVGFVESTQATAGVWATSPSLVQGQSGQSSSGALGIGVGQTWQNVKPSRASGVTYTNTTGRPIMVTTSHNSPNGWIDHYAIVDGVRLSSDYSPSPTSTVGGGSHSFIVPNGSTYSVTFVVCVCDYWAELR